MSDLTSDRAHVERAVRVTDHFAPTVAALKSADSSDSADIVDILACRVLAHQWDQLSQAADRPATHVVDVVRPAVSEFVLMRYLCQLLRHDATALVAARVHIGAADDRSAGTSRSMPGPDDLSDGPSGPMSDPDDDAAADHERLTLDALADLGHRLGWALGRTNHLGPHALPTDRWMAAAVGELHVYDELTTGRAPSSGTSASDHQLAWGSLLLCRTATAVRQLVRSSNQLPAARQISDLIAECAAALPSTSTAPRSLAC